MNNKKLVEMVKELADNIALSRNEHEDRLWNVERKVLTSDEGMALVNKVKSFIANKFDELESDLRKVKRDIETNSLRLNSQDETTNFYTLIGVRNQFSKASDEAWRELNGLEARAYKFY